MPYYNDKEGVVLTEVVASTIQKKKGIQLFNKVRSTEAKIRDRLHKELGGYIEVLVPIGSIDLLTQTELIEVKRRNEWKCALGQVLAYSRFYPQHTKRIHLFGKEFYDPITGGFLIKICSDLGVVVTFEEILDETSSEVEQ